MGLWPGPSGPGFTGEQHDSLTGNLYLRARYLMPGIGRFSSADSVQPNAPGSQGYNRYAYTANNPTTWTDPSGHILPFLPFLLLFGQLTIPQFMILTFLILALILLLMHQCYALGFCGSAPPQFAPPDFSSLPLNWPELPNLEAPGIPFVPWVPELGTGGSTADNPFDGTPYSDWTFPNTRKENQARRRGWTDHDIQDVLDAPADVNPDATDWTKNPAEPATQYFDEDGHYVIQNDNTGEIVQTSDRNDPNWIDPYTHQPVRPR